MRRGLQQDDTTARQSALRKVQGPAAVATWSLRRHRRLSDASAEQALLLSRVTADAAVDLDRQRLLYRGRAAAVRPAVARLLARLLHAGGGRVPVGDVCAAVYGRPASLRAVRQSAFRASRAMEQVDCPLVVCCHDAHLFARHHVRCFERRLYSRNSK